MEVEIFVIVVVDLSNAGQLGSQRATARKLTLSYRWLMASRG
jgi:hypothetical protein